MTIAPKSILTATAAAVITAGTILLSQSTVQPQPTLHIQSVNVACTNQAAPVSGYFTNYGNTNFVIAVPASGINSQVEVKQFNGAAIQIWWTAQAGISYILQFSTDLTHWTDIPWVFIGSGQIMSWLDDGASIQKFFRLRMT